MQLKILLMNNIGTNWQKHLKWNSLCGLSRFVMPSILWLFLVPCPVPSQPDGEPVENLNKGDEAEPKAKTK